MKLSTFRTLSRFDQNNILAEKVLGWRIAVVDGRESYRTQPDDILVGYAEPKTFNPHDNAQDDELFLKEVRWNWTDFNISRFGDYLRIIWHERWLSSTLAQQQVFAEQLFMFYTQGDYCEAAARALDERGLL